MPCISLTFISLDQGAHFGSFIFGNPHKLQSGLLVSVSLPFIHLFLHYINRVLIHVWYNDRHWVFIFKELSGLDGVVDKQKGNGSIAQ